MDVPAESSSAPTRRNGVWRWLLPSTWQFSIRELLLLTAAVAAFLACAGLFYERSRPFGQTSIPSRIGQTGDVEKICRSLGHQIASYSSGGSGSSDMHACNYLRDFRIDLPASLHGPFMKAYLQTVRATLDSHADDVWGPGKTSSGATLNGFEFSYSKDSTQGRVVVRSAGRDAELSVFVFVHEYQAKR